MNLSGPYIINDQEYSDKELISISNEIQNSGDIDKWQKDVYSFIMDFLKEDVSLVHSTSGTTGKAKTMILDRQSMIRSAEQTISHFGISPGTTALLCLPLEYIAGKMMLVRALVGNLNLLTVEPSARPLQNLDRQIAFSAMVPLQLYETMTQDDPAQLRRIKTLLLGGGEISHSLRKDIEKLEQVEVHETFGMSETYTHIASRRINGSDPDHMFKPLKGVGISQDERGCLVVDIPGITDGPVLTNDMVYIEEDQGFEWLGRIDNVINSGGIKINPEALECKIQGIIGLDLAITAIPDTKLGEKIVLVLETDYLNTPFDEIMDSLRGNLERFEVPKLIVSQSELPRNKSMKLDRRQLKLMALMLTANR